MSLLSESWEWEIGVTGCESGLPGSVCVSSGERSGYKSGKCLVTGESGQTVSCLKFCEECDGEERSWVSVVVTELTGVTAFLREEKPYIHDRLHDYGMVLE